MHTYTHMHTGRRIRTHKMLNFLIHRHNFLLSFSPPRPPLFHLPPLSTLSYPILSYPILSYLIPLYPFPLEGNLHCLLALGEYVELEDSALALRNHLKNAEQVEEYSSWMAEVQKLGSYVTFYFDSFNI